AANADVIRAAQAAGDRGVEPTSEEAHAIVEAYLDGIARASHHVVDAAFRAGARARFARQDPRAMRYWELVAVLGGRHPTSSNVQAWKWIVRAVLHHIPEA